MELEINVVLTHEESEMMDSIITHEGLMVDVGRTITETIASNFGPLLESNGVTVLASTTYDAFCEAVDSFLAGLKSSINDRVDKLFTGMFSKRYFCFDSVFDILIQSTYLCR